MFPSQLLSLYNLQDYQDLVKAYILVIPSQFLSMHNLHDHP